LDSASKFRLAAGDSFVETFDIEDGYFDDSYYDSQLYVSVSTMSDESDLGNNSEVVTVFRDCDVTIQSTAGGTVSGAGTFAYGSAATITATPTEGYKFYAWAEDGYILYGTPETYEITVNEDRALKALFVLDTEESVTISGTAYQLKTPGGDLGGVAPGLTVTLDNGYTTTTDTDGSFTFSNVESGAYLLTISGNSTIDRFVIVSTTDANTNAGNVAVACFDYVNDSVIDEQDTTAWGQWLSTNHTVSNVFADINADGVVNAKDLAYINKFKNKTKSNIYSEIIE
jgi:hypothetical protein